MNGIQRCTHVIIAENRQLWNDRAVVCYDFRFNKQVGGLVWFKPEQHEMQITSVVIVDLNHEFRIGRLPAFQIDVDIPAICHGEILIID